MIDHYGRHRPHPATAGPVPAERMIDRYKAATARTPPPPAPCRRSE